MATQTGLDFLRTRTVVDCDTLDEEGIRVWPLSSRQPANEDDDSCENPWSVS